MLNSATRQKIVRVLKRHKAFIGPGIVSSVAYTDPGNWVTDLAAGSQYGYALLFVVFLSGIFGIFLQILAVRLGVVTGQDLAQTTRSMLLPEESKFVTPRQDSRNGTGSRREHASRPLRMATLWILYLISEAAIIATELAELIGSAIGINLLFPFIPVSTGVLITSLDVLLILVFYRPDSGNIRILEVFIALLVLVVMGCFIVLTARTDPNWTDVAVGYLPSTTLFEPGALYTSVGIIGAVIMPHALYLGSHFSTVNREACPEPSEPRKTWKESFNNLELYLRNPRIAYSKICAAFTSPADPTETCGFCEGPSRMSIQEMETHLPHASFDIAFSLFFLAISINSAILIVAAAAFYYRDGNGGTDVGDLYDAFELLKNGLGHIYAILFAIALLAAGQAASLTCTIAGQIVSTGFINWTTNPFVRRLVTRLITVIPSIIIATSVGREGLDKALVASQVVLAFALPFVLVPLGLVTASKAWMTVYEVNDVEAGDSDYEGITSDLQRVHDERVALLVGQPTQKAKGVDFSNGSLSNYFMVIIFVIIVVADIYTLVTM